MIQIRRDYIRNSSVARISSTQPTPASSYGVSVHSASSQRDSDFGEYKEGTLESPAQQSITLTELFERDESPERNQVEQLASKFINPEEDEKRAARKAQIKAKMEAEDEAERNQKNSIIQSVEKDTEFEKQVIDVISDVKPLSILTAQLGTFSSGLEMDSFKSRRGTNCSIVVFIACVETSKRKLVVELMGGATVAEFIELVLLQYNDEGRLPPLQTDRLDRYQLRMVDDIISGTIDEDFPPFAKDHDIIKLHVDGVVLTRSAGVSPESLTSISKTRGTILGRGARNDGFKEFKVIFENREFKCDVLNTMHLDKILGAMSKNTGQDMHVANYEIYDATTSSPVLLEWGMSIDQLRSECVLLKSKVSSIQDVNVIQSDRPIQPSDFLFNDENASFYEEFVVIKTNSRGRRQKRIMGIDRDKIYNKELGSKIHSTFFGDAGVKRKYRLISDVVKAEVDSGFTFRVLYRDIDTNAIVFYQYDAIDEFECCKIVAKIEFLRRQILVR